MQLTGHPFHLTYCTNIHPANGWAEVLATLERYAPALKARLAPDRPFAIGLRLSGVESRQLLAGDRLAELRAFLDRHGLYVATINGFPHGPFHQLPVKANVHAPDWRDEERVAYTLRLIDILSALLPPGLDGGISTNPLSYKAWLDLDDTATWQQLTRNVVRVAAKLVEVRRKRDQVIHLDIEPEPDGVLENSREVVRFYDDWLLPVGAPLLAELANLSLDEARHALLDHIRICFDTCHVAVAYEEPAAVLDRFAAAGIQVGRVQVSSALKVPFPKTGAPRTALAGALSPFAESTYLHQVVQRDHDGRLRQYPDLQEALPSIQDPAIAEWRIHFHVPIFVDRYASFGSTQDDIRRTFEQLHARGFTRYLEIETYTWGVLPSDLKRDLLESIAREYEWVLDVVA